MNQKKAKVLRKIAQGATVGEPIAKYKGRNPQHRWLEYPGMPGRAGFVKTAKGIPFTLLPTCTRAVYQKLKKAYKKSQRYTGLPA